MITMIHPAGYAKSPHYSQGAEVRSPNRTLYISGQVGVDAQGNMGQGIAEQAKIAVANMNAVLAEAGMDANEPSQGDDLLDRREPDPRLHGSG